MARVVNGADEVKVVVRYSDRGRGSIGALESTRARGHSGFEIPLREVAETRLVRGYSTITRQDGMRRIRIQADIDKRAANGVRIVQNMLGTFLPDLE